MRSESLPKIEDLVHNRLYWIRSRNLVLGIWDSEKRGFTGIRRKWDDRFLFTEYHWDTGEPYGTVMDAIDTEVDLPKGAEKFKFLDQFILSHQNPFQINIKIWKDAELRKGIVVSEPFESIHGRRSVNVKINEKPGVVCVSDNFKIGETILINGYGYGVKDEN